MKVRKTVNFLEIDYEFRPFLNELHTLYNQTKVPITKSKVIDYLYSQESARLLFAINYSKKQDKKESELQFQSKILNPVEYPVLKN